MSHRASHRRRSARRQPTPAVVALSLAAGATGLAAANRPAVTSAVQAQAPRLGSAHATTTAAAATAATSVTASRTSANLTVSRAAARGALPSVDPSLAGIDPAVEVALPAGATRTSWIDSTPTIQARAALAKASSSYTRTKASYDTAKRTAAAARAALTTARSAANASPSSAAASVSSATEVAGVAATAVAQGPAAALGSVVRPVVASQSAVAKALAADSAATQSLAAAATAHQISIRDLKAAIATVGTRTQADLRAGVSAGTVIQLKDGSLVPSLAVGTRIPGNGHTVDAQMSQWIGKALTTLYANGYPRNDSDAFTIATIAYNESGGRAAVVNTYDSNAAKGMPSFGLMQTIGQTFDNWHLAGYDDKADPVHQLMAGARYAVAAYGSLENVPGVKSLAAGGRYLAY